MRWSVCLLLLLACGEPSSKDAEDEPTETDTDAVETDEPTDVPLVHQTIDGLVTWNIVPDADAVAQGYEPCSYTRHYVGTVDPSAPWLCTECDAVFLVDVTLEPGGDACTEQYGLSIGPVERLAFHDGQWYRGNQAFSVLSARGPLVVDGERHDVSQSYGPVQVSGGGTYSGEVSGSLTVTEAPGESPAAMVPPSTHACGWDQQPAAPYTGDYATAVGELVPDGTFYDACGEPVRLHHLLGRWLLIDASAANCPPCALMAMEAEDAIESLREEGIDIEMVTVLGYDLANMAGPTPDDLPFAWTDYYGLTGPVLGDRGWNDPVVVTSLETYAYPTTLLVDPSGNVVETIVGFSEWKPIKKLVRQHALP